MKFKVFWSGLVSRVGASHGFHLIAPFPLDGLVQEKLIMRLDTYLRTGTSEHFPNWGGGLTSDFNWGGGRDSSLSKFGFIFSEKLGGGL